jgi:hypothetical protein
VNLPRFLAWQGDDLVTANCLLKVLLPQNGRIALLFFVRLNLFFVMLNLLRGSEVCELAEAAHGTGSMKGLSMEKDDLGATSSNSTSRLRS